MKFKNIYFFAGLIGLFILLQGKAGGPATQLNIRATGAPGDGTCGNTNCHTAGSFGPTMAMSVFDGANLAIKYDPGKTYTLRLTVSATSGTPAEYGFQAVSLNASDAQAGAWGTLPAGMGKKTLATRSYVEHIAPMTNSVIEVPWVAPAAGTGAVTFYASTLATNNNNQASGDGTVKGTLTIEENGPSSTTDLSQQFASIKVVPNPVDEVMNLQINSRSAGDHKIRIMSTTGAVLRTEPILLQVGQNTASISVSDLAPGLYLVQLCGNGHLAAAQLLKR